MKITINGVYKYSQMVEIYELLIKQFTTDKETCDYRLFGEVANYDVEIKDDEIVISII